jgi:hypothetical protein
MRLYLAVREPPLAWPQVSDVCTHPSPANGQGKNSSPAASTRNAGGLPRRAGEAIAVLAFVLGFFLTKNTRVKKPQRYSTKKRKHADIKRRTIKAPRKNTYNVDCLSDLCSFVL